MLRSSQATPSALTTNVFPSRPEDQRGTNGELHVSVTHVPPRHPAWVIRPTPASASIGRRRLVIP
jgi:hypothetical protein